MDKLLIIREFVHSEGGKMLLEFCKDFMVETSTKNTNAELIKGMGLLINHIQEIDEKCRTLIEKE